MVMRKVYLRPTMSPTRPNTSAPNGRTAKPAANAEQREDETRRRVDAREELLGQDRSERAVDVEVVPLEHGAERGGEDDEALFARHAAGARLIDGDCGHWRSSPIASSFFNSCSGLPARPLRITQALASKILGTDADVCAPVVLELKLENGCGAATIVRCGINRPRPGFWQRTIRPFGAMMLRQQEPGPHGRR